MEETIVGREIECGVLGMNEPKASGVGEVLSAEEFYSYDAKYNNEESRTVVDPELPEGKAEEIRKDAVAIFKAFRLLRIIKSRLLPDKRYKRGCNLRKSIHFQALQLSVCIQCSGKQEV